MFLQISSGFHKITSVILKSNEIEIKSLNKFLDQNILLQK